MKLTINLITRGRPERLVDTIARTLPNIVCPETRMIVSIDDDDPETIEAIKAFEADPRVMPIIRPREDALGEKWNRAMLVPADVYMPLGDYTPLVTPAFDQKVLDAASLFPDNIGVVYSHMANASFPSIWCVTHGLAMKMGGLCPPYFPYWFVDHWVDDIARMIGRISFVDMQTDVGIKPTTQEYREAAFWATVFDCLRLKRRAQARSIIDSPDFQEPEWRKEILRNHYPLIEFRSQWINDTVRSWKPAPFTPGGDRYDRLRVQALKLMEEEFPKLADDMALNDKRAA